MPEAPELRVSADFITQHCGGLAVVDIGTTGSGRYRHSPPEGLGRFAEMLRYEHGPFKLQIVQTRGKFMWWHFVRGAEKVALHITYGMSGMWHPIDPSRSTHVGFFVRFCDSEGKERPLSFVDPRHFGTIKLAFDPKVTARKLGTLGPDPFGPDFEYDRLLSLFESRKSKIDPPICELMMDQRIFCGVGNYIRAEAMWRAKVYPWTPARSLSKRSWKALVDASKDVMMESYFSQGATLRTYVTAHGKEGEFEFNVYGRSIDASGGEVRKETDSNGRNVHWSPARQVKR